MSDITTNESRIRPLIDTEIGLNKSEIDERIANNLINGEIDTPTKTVKQIFKKNFLTLFNLINLVLAVMIISVGAIKNAFFVILVFINTLVGLIQELRSKKTIDKLSLLSAPKATVLRDSVTHSIVLKDILLDEIMILQTGNQICADSRVVSGEFEVNESLLTGEPDAILKKTGDKLMSGSFVVSGYGKAQVEKIGKDNYVAKITAGAKYLKKTNSEIMRSLDAVIKLMTVIIFPLAIILLLKNFATMTLTVSDVIVTTVAQIIGMIPEGLVLLTTLVFAAGVIRLAKYNTLVQDIYCIETLARVNILCLDKTGTITTGGMQVDEIIPISKSNEEISEIMNALAFTLNDNNPTFTAIKEKFTVNPFWTSSSIIPFSSSRKYSCVAFQNVGTYLLGAGEFILNDNYVNIENTVNEFSKEGKRVLVLAYSENEVHDNILPQKIEVVGLVILSDTIRKEAPETLKYFAEQGVDIRIISGDNPITVSNIAHQAGLIGAEKYIDASKIKSDSDLDYALDNFKVFGRVTPEQKLAFVKALKKKGNIVAMTGDGVNDVLALKESDCSIAMASGSDAARSVSSLILMDNNFASMPRIVAEGRRGINNLQRSSSLFLIKTIYATMFAILFIFLPFKYPYEPIQLTLVSSILCGIPTLFLALEPNKDRLRGKFLTNAVTTALPGALYIVISTIVLLILTDPKIGLVSTNFDQQTSIATMLLGSIMWFVLLQNCSPFSKMRVTLVSVCGLLFVMVMLSPYISSGGFFGFIAKFFDMTKLTWKMALCALILVAFTVPFMLVFKKLLTRVNTTDKLMQKMMDFTENIAMGTNSYDNEDRNFNQKQTLVTKLQQLNFSIKSEAKHGKDKNAEKNNIATKKAKKGK